MRYYEDPPSPRTVWNQPDLNDPNAPSNQGGPFKPTGEYRDFERPDRTLEGSETNPDAVKRANLVSSLTERGTHRPVIDIDGGCQVVPSKTPGHFHLYIDREMDWATYENLLYALVRAGVVEPNYLRAASDAGKTFVRLRPEERPARTPSIGERGY